MGFGHWISHVFDSAADPGTHAGYQRGEAEADKDYDRGMAGQYDQRGAIQGTDAGQAASYGNAAGARVASFGAGADQQGALGLMRDAATGAAPSAAAQQQAAGTDASIKALMATTASARGGGMAQAAAQRHAQNQGASLMQQNVQQTGILRAQEMANARGAYGQQANAIRDALMHERGMDIGQAGQQSQYSLGQGQLALGSRGQNDAMHQHYMDDAFNRQQLAQQGDIANQGAQTGVNLQGAQINQANATGAVNTLATVGGYAAMASDENLKDHRRSLSMTEIKDIADAGSGAQYAGKGIPTADPGGGFLKGMALAKLGGKTGGLFGGDEGSPDGGGSGMGNIGGDLGESRNANPGVATANRASENAEGFQWGGGSASGDMGAAGAGGGMDAGGITGGLGGGMDAGGTSESDERAKKRDADLREPALRGPVFGYIGDTLRGLAGMKRDPELDRPLAAARAGVGTAVDAAGEQAVRHAGVDRRLEMAGFAPWHRSNGATGLAYQDTSISDERAKRAEAKAEPALFMDQLRPAAFRYKPGVPGEDPRIERYGVMAQDVEKTPMGASFVVDTPIGKQLDTKHGFGAVLASLANLNDRLRAQEDMAPKKRRSAA